MSLEVSQADEHISIHHGVPDQSLFGIFSPFNRYCHVIGTFQPIGDYDRAADRKGRKTVLPGAFKMLQGILPESWIHGVAVGEERLATELLDQIHDGLGIIGAEITDIAQFPEVHLDRYELAAHVYVGDPGLSRKPFQFGRHTLSVYGGSEIRIKYLRAFHGDIFIIISVASYP